MKKTILALAVAAASLASVAQADNTTLYGSVRLAVQYNDDGTDSSTKVSNASSRWGIKGSDDLGNGLKAIYQFEWQVHPNSAAENITGRLGYVGLSGDFGTVALGRQWSPYYNVAGYNDLFNNVYYDDYMGVFRLGHVLSYTTPDMGGFQLQAALIADGLGGNDEHLDGYNISALYDNNGIFAGLSYISTNGLADEQSQVALALGYSNDMFRIGFVGEYADDGVTDTNPRSYDLAGEYYINDMDTIRAGVSLKDADVEGVDDAYEAALGYEHKFSKRTRVWAEYSYIGDGHIFDGDNLINIDDAQNKVSLGIRTDF